MNKLFNKFLVLVLSLTVAFAAVACDNNGGSSEPPSTSILPPPQASISIDDKSLVVGDDYTIVPKLSNVKEDLVWSVVEGEDVISVDKYGKVTALKKGTAKVSASANGTSDTCTISVDYGTFIPEFSTTSGIGLADSTLVLAQNYNLLPYVLFNGKQYDDADYTFEVGDASILSVSEESGKYIINTLKKGSTTLTIKATWREFGFADYNTLEKTVNINIKDDVNFYVDGNIPEDIIIETPASFISVQNHKNVKNINPSVKINGEIYTDVDVTVTSINNTPAENYTYNSETKTLTSNALGSVNVELRKGEFFCNFVVTMNRPVKEYDSVIDMFSANRGDFKEVVNGEYVNVSLAKKVWGDDSVVFYDAYQDATKLQVSGNKVLGLVTDNAGPSMTRVKVGTKTEVYDIPVNAAAYFIATGEEFEDALDNDYSTNKITLYGYYKLLNDIDFKGLTFENAVYSSGKYVGGTTFAGVFDGAGHVVFNAKVLQNNANNSSPGIFGVLKGTIKDVAFYNLSDFNGSQLLSSPIATLADSGSKVSNVYVHASPEFESRRGVAIGRIDKNATISNFVVEFPVDKPTITEDWLYSNDATRWNGIGSLFNNIQSFYGDNSKVSNLYVVSKYPLLYNRGGSDYNATGAQKEYFAYGENETDVWFNFKFFETQLGAGVTPTVQNTKIDITTSNDLANTRTVVMRNVRRYDDYAAMANDTSDKHLENLEKFKEGGSWVIVNNAPIFKTLYEKYHHVMYNTSVTADGQPIDSDIYQMPLGSTKTLSFATSEAGAEFVSVTSSNQDVVSVNGSQITALASGESIVTFTYKTNGYLHEIPFTVKVVKEVVLTETSLVLFETKTGKLYTKHLEGLDVILARVNGEDFTVDNGGLIKDSDGVKLKVKTSSSDIGITDVDLNNYKDNKLDIVFETATAGYKFTNVEVFDVVISTPQKFLDTLDNGSKDAEGAVKNVEISDVIGLANTLDMAGYTFDNTAGTIFKGYFDGNGYVVSNLTVTGYNPNNGAGGIFGSIFGYVKNVAFTNVMGTGSRGLLSSPLGVDLPWNGLRNDNNIENVYIQTSADILDYFNAAGPRIDYRAKVVNFVIDAPVADQTIDETWMNTGTSYTGKGSFTSNPSTLIEYGTNNLNNIYVISKMPLLYQKGSTPNLDSLGASADYFAYGENETKVHFNFTYFKTQLGEGVEPTVQNTQVVDDNGKQVTNTKASKTFVLKNIRRYDDMTAFAGDTSDEHVANLAEMEATGMWKVVDSKLYWAKLAPQA